jgi:UDP-glucose 4,6-dehydratase
MVLVLGAESYIGRVFCTELLRRGHEYASLTAKDYSDFHSLFNCVRRVKPKFMVNATGCAGADPDANEPARGKILQANTILPRYIAQVCLMTNTPWGHISSCGIYSGAKVVIGTGVVVEKKIAREELVRMIEDCPEKIRGFTEADEPNFSFRTAPCNFLSGTAALAEEAIRGIGRNYLWRLGKTFNERDEPENFLGGIQHAEKIYNGVQAYSHTEDFVHACLDLWEREAPFGIYSVANPGILTASQITDIIRKTLNPPRHFEFWQDDIEFYNHANRVLRCNYVLDVSKLLATGIEMRPLTQAIEDSLRNWHSDTHQGEIHKAAA